MAYKDPAKKAAYMKEYNKTYYPEWAANNRDKTRAASARFQEANSEKISERKRERYANDPKVIVMHREYQAQRRARLREQLCDCCSRADLFEFYVIANAKTTETGIEHEVDHIDPLSNGGAHCAKNLRVITREENRAKGKKVI